MNCNLTPLKGLLLLTPAVYTDNRGHFFESFNAKTFKRLTGMQPEFVQTNESLSKRGVLRGLHWQSVPRAQGKLVRVVHGAVFDVVVDLRENSDTFGQWYGCELSDTNHAQLWIPPGFAHGFLTLTDHAITSYQVTEHHSPEHECCLAWNDPVLNIDWPLKRAAVAKPVLSQKDSEGMLFTELSR
ncbi:MAG: dTDP-4-dehydrorhamnose 3,5-epimerase [Burkholderiales bacterium]|jgi:dTDP-4-dehydrorhamnose 3,5-epimerase|uniref:dTDP-4-dehydrorhamnose 3,5-epimerase n=1 Tax=Limnobacter sp. TaxID=2003368 RepID=UPI00393D3AE0|nr:dTDP-4-dehydrorhamnose 3,5-epimerase [Burkholderiales bacterium]